MKKSTSTGPAGIEDPSPATAAADPREPPLTSLSEPALYSRIFDALRDHAIFALDEEGRIASWSRGARSLTGYAEEEVVGRSFGIFSAQENEAELERVLQTALDRQRSERERWWRIREGGLVRVDEVINPLDGGGFAVVVRDLTARVQAEDRKPDAASAGEEGLGREQALRSELRAVEHRTAFLAEASSILVTTSLDLESTLRALVRLAVSRLGDWCAIHALGDDGQLVWREVGHRDPGLEEPLKDAVDRALNEPWEGLLRSVIRTGQAQVLDRRATGSWFRYADDAVSGDHEIRSGSAMVTPLLGRGEVLGAMTVVSTDHDYDENDLALAEELGRRAAIALDNARLYREAQEANRAKADFLAVVSHELRTPLNAIMGYSDLLDAQVSGELSDKQHRQVNRVRASARHLLQLIEEILSYARIESGGEEVRPEVVDGRELASEAAAVIEPIAIARGLEFRLEPGPQRLTLETDPGKARQILVNLLSNAVKFTERGSVTLRLRQEGESAFFDVIDTGIGIPDEAVERIFDPFRQVEPPNVRRTGGTGLGLSVSRRYIRLLRGEITVESRPGSGSRFTVEIPLRFAGTSGTPAHRNTTG